MRVQIPPTGRFNDRSIVKHTHKPLNAYVTHNVTSSCGIPKGEVMRVQIPPTGGFNDRSIVKHTLRNTQNDCHQWLFDSSATNSFSAGALPLTPLGELTVLPTGPLAGLTGVRGKGEGKKEGEEGIVLTHLFVFSAYATDIITSDVLF